MVQKISLMLNVEVQSSVVSSCNSKFISKQTNLYKSQGNVDRVEVISY